MAVAANAIETGVGRFQTAKVFLLISGKEQVVQVRCWSLSNSEGVSPQRLSRQ